MVALLIAKDKVSQPQLDEIISALGQASISPLIFWISPEADLLNWLQAHTNVRRALTLGGDGTFHHVVEALTKLPQENRPSVAAVPLGTANDFARAALPAEESLSQAVVRLAKAPARWVDVAYVNGKPFINVASGGAAATTTTEAPSALKGLFGKFAYYLTALSKAGNIPHNQLKFVLENGDTVNLDCIGFAVANSSQAGGGLKVGPEAKIDDGVLDLLIVPCQGFLSLVALATELLCEQPNLRDHEVLYKKSRRFTLESDTEIQINLDGEPMTGKKFEFCVEPRSIEAVVASRLLSQGPSPTCR